MYNLTKEKNEEYLKLKKNAREKVQAIKFNSKLAENNLLETDETEEVWTISLWNGDYNAYKKGNGIKNLKYWEDTKE